MNELFEDEQQYIEERIWNYFGGKYEYISPLLLLPQSDILLKLFKDIYIRVDDEMYNAVAAEGLLYSTGIVNSVDEFFANTVNNICLNMVVVSILRD